MSSGLSRTGLFRTFGLLELANGCLKATYTTFVGLLGHKHLDDFEPPNEHNVTNVSMNTNVSMDFSTKGVVTLLVRLERLHLDEFKLLDEFERGNEHSLLERLHGRERLDRLDEGCSSTFNTSR